MVFHLCLEEIESVNTNVGAAVFPLGICCAWSQIPIFTKDKMN